MRPRVVTAGRGEPGGVARLGGSAAGGDVAGKSSWFRRFWREATEAAPELRTPCLSPATRPRPRLPPGVVFGSMAAALWEENGGSLSFPLLREDLKGEEAIGGKISETTENLTLPSSTDRPTPFLFPWREPRRSPGS